MGMRTTADDFFAADSCVCACRELELDVQDAVEAAHCCVRPRQRLLKFSEATALAAYRALATCREDGCVVHGDEYESNAARTSLVERLGEAADV
jgi:hypothetical protein